MFQGEGSGGKVTVLLCSREKPLAMYVFSNNKQVVRDLKENTSSGGFLVNDTLVHAGSKFSFHCHLISHRLSLDSHRCHLIVTGVTCGCTCRGGLCLEGWESEAGVHVGVVCVWRGCGCV